MKVFDVINDVLSDTFSYVLKNTISFETADHMANAPYEFITGGFEVSFIPTELLGDLTLATKADKTTQTSPYIHASTNQ